MKNWVLGGALIVCVLVAVTIVGHSAQVAEWWPPNGVSGLTKIV